MTTLLFALFLPAFSSACDLPAWQSACEGQTNSGQYIRIDPRQMRLLEQRLSLYNKMYLGVRLQRKNLDFQDQTSCDGAEAAMAARTASELRKQAERGGVCRADAIRLRLEIQKYAGKDSEYLEGIWDGLSNAEQTRLRGGGVMLETVAQGALGEEVFAEAAFSEESSKRAEENRPFLYEGRAQGPAEKEPEESTVRSAQ